jgi:23S rRNA (cytosine1962-C5)-methyltransferase
MSFSKIILKSGKDQSLLRFHPWVFSGAIKDTIGFPAEGDVVEVFSNKDEFLGMGHYQIGSITVRLFSFQPAEPDYNFWKNKIYQAFLLRKRLALANSDHTNVYRLVNAEGDGMPGLIIDYYNGTAVMQMHSIGMYRIRTELAQAMKDIFGDALQAVYDKSESTIPFKSQVHPKNEYIFGEARPELVSEYGNLFRVDWVDGQKTGFFIDQRENRKLVEVYAQGKDVLNVFGYTGGFSIYAIRGGAQSVHSVDSSQKAIDLTNENVKLNFPECRNHVASCVDAFDYLDTIDDKFDLIILDPPAFAKHFNVLNNAVQGYKRINAKAIKKIKPGGILFTFSCSQVVDKETFRNTIFSAAASTGRHVRILHQLTQPADHPVNIYHPEGEYLKGLVLYIE